MDLRLKGKRAIVTGGSRGIGLAIARALLEEQVAVVIAARDAEVLAAAVERLHAETGGHVEGIVTDTRDDESVDRLVQGAVERLGGLDIVVNAAASTAGPPAGPGIAGVTSAYILEELDTKLVGYVRVARAAAPHLVSNGWGRIINISGLAARQVLSIPGSARNVAVAAFTKNLADELSPKGVNVTVVHPGATRTEKTPERVRAWAQANGRSEEEAEQLLFGNSLLGRIVESEEVADVVLFLASPRSVAITGDAIAAGGGTRGAIHY